MNGVRGIDIKTQIPHKLNEENSWKEVSGKKRNRNSSEQTMSGKQSRTDNYWLSETML